MASKVTLEDVAKRAGVHRSTVSLALRDHPRISLPVRRRIQTLATSMGYRINPLVAALMRSRRTGRDVKNIVLAYVTNYSTRYGWRAPYHDRPDYFPGAAARAQELGYKLEHFWLAEPGMTPERFCDILTARDIHGVVLGRLPPGQSELTLVWERFSAVALGLTLQSPGVHRVAEDHYSASINAMDRLIERGYRRIGFVFSTIDDSPRVGERWTGAYLRQQLRLSPENRLPMHFYHSGPEHLRNFETWFRQHRPDAILATHARALIGWLKALGVRVPQDVGVATLVNDHPEEGWSGMHCPAAKLGGLAVEMLIGLMTRAETGLPTDPHEVLLRADWIEGNTLRKTNP